MARLKLDALPPGTNKGAIFRLVLEAGGLSRHDVGAIELRGREVVVEVPDRAVGRLVEALDGASLGNQHIRASADAAGAGAAGDEHFQRLKDLLKLESDAEAEEARRYRLGHPGADAERTGESLVRLVIRDACGGLGGRVLVTLGKRGEAALPWTRLGAGAPVILAEEGANEATACRGVVIERSEKAIQVALGREPIASSERGTFRLDAADDEVARQRQAMALERAGAAVSGRLAHLRDVLLLKTPPSFVPASAAACEPLDVSLDPSQREAVRFCLTSEDLAVIHGPPGTGKTTAVVELIRQAVRRGQTVLACAPSNLAVDNVLQGLLAAGEKAIRLGHPARVLPVLREHTLDVLVENDPDVRLARRLRRDAHALRAKAGKRTRAVPEPGERQGMRLEAQGMLDDAERIEALAVERLLDSAPVLCATTTGIDAAILGQRRFDLCVIDEACQSTEPGAWIPLLRCDRVVLAGDHCQLPPTVISAEAARRGFGVSLMERVMEAAAPLIARRLSVQYRMHEAIMGLSSAEFYEGTLSAHASVARHLLQDLPGVQASELTATPILFVDTAGAGWVEQEEPDGESRRNPQEAAWVRGRVAALLDAGVPPAAIGVIAPYAAQVRLLQERLPPAVEASSVDGFQGREKEAIVISLVRSNPQAEIGFLAETRRMNVALTRARRSLVVIGDSATITADPFYRRMVDYFERLGAYRSVWEDP